MSGGLTTSHQAEPEYLYHYTSTQGLRGILTDRCIWATDSAFLNDASEIRYAGRALRLDLTNYVSEVEKISQPTPGSGGYHRLTVIKSALDALTKFVEVDEVEDPSYARDCATYVACFSEEPDQLSQWRGYGGRGYSIGFNKQGLNKLVVKGEEPRKAAAGDIGPVGYGQPAGDQLCADVREYFAGRPISAHPGTSGFFDAANFLMPKLARVKHKAFEDEREWRLAVSRYGGVPVRNVCFRYGIRLIPYVELQFDPSAVARIYIGPGGDFHSERALRAFLRVSGYEPNRVRIEHSSAPFRDSQAI